MMENWPGKIRQMQQLWKMAWGKCDRQRHIFFQNRAVANVFLNFARTKIKRRQIWHRHGLSAQFHTLIKCCSSILKRGQNRNKRKQYSTKKRWPVLHYLNQFCGTLLTLIANDRTAFFKLKFRFDTLYIIDCLIFTNLLYLMFQTILNWRPSWECSKHFCSIQWGVLWGLVLTLNNLPLLHSP